MASLQAVRRHGRTYWRIVESRRVNGKPRPVPIAYLGRSADVLARLQATEALRVRSLSHGAVAALYALSNELDVAGAIDRLLTKHGCRLRPSQEKRKQSTAPTKNDGLSVGQSLALIAILRFGVQPRDGPVLHGAMPWRAGAAGLLGERGAEAT